ncbi:MAG: hypothetical protein ACM3S1_12485, partial [Hyphomicrobiales bacterium]
AAIATLSLSGATVFGTGIASAAGPGSTAFRPALADCPPGQDCRPSYENAIAEAKMAAALAYSNQQGSRVSNSDLEGLEKWVRALTGEAKREVHPSSPPDPHEAPNDIQARVRSESNLQKYFWAFEQVTPYYCGPATVQSILRFLGPHTSQAANPMGGRDEMTGDPYHDQQVLARDYWLATDRNGGTNWGSAYVPDTINTWRGTRWYVASGTPNVGGTLTKDEALAAIKYDTDRSFPVAENVMYSPQTYYPAGFYPGATYMHWDTIYGHYQDGGRQMVQVGQTYHDPGLPYERFQNVPWDVHWSAIGNWFGIVW